MSVRIQFHSDVSFFAGCENMLVNFFNDGSFTGRYDVSFSYRYSDVYEQGYKEKVTGRVNSYPLALLDIEQFWHRANKLSFRPWALVVKIISQFLKLIYIGYNTIILYKLFKKNKIDLLHINNGGYPGAYSCMSAVFAAKLSGIRNIVYVVNNVAFSYRHPGRWVDYFFDKIVKNTVSVFVTGSVYAGEELKKVLRLPPQKIKNIKNGISLRPPTEDRAAFFKRLGLPEGRVLIGVVAVLEERKGHKYLLQAVKLLKDKGMVQKLPYFLIEGHGSLLEPLEQYVAQQKLGDCVRFVKGEKNISNLMNAIDLLVLPSINNEDFPNVVLEAMGWGKPVVASNICGIPEQIENMKSGILVEPKDVEGLQAAISQLLENPSLLQSMGERGREIFNKRFLASIAVRNYTELYEGIFQKTGEYNENGYLMRRAWHQDQRCG